METREERTLKIIETDGILRGPKIEKIIEIRSIPRLSKIKKTIQTENHENLSIQG